jgi:hypothetical protein
MFLANDYLEPLDLDYNEIELANELKKLEENAGVMIKSYPFTKEELLTFLESKEFLSVIFKDENKEKPTTFELANICKNLPEEYKKEQILREKRRRNQAYKTLDYYLSNLTFYDYFSTSAFEIAKNAKYITQSYGQEEVSLEFLFLTFFDPEFVISDILREEKLNSVFFKKFLKKLKKNITPTIKKLNLVEKCYEVISNIKIRQICTKFLDIINNNADDFYEYIKYSLGYTRFPRYKNEESKFDQEIFFSFKVHTIFEKCTKNAQERFKTPIITPEIIFITLMENNKLEITKFIRKTIKGEAEFYVLRYRLLKRLYHQEINVRQQVSRNQQFFAYLMKTKISESSFDQLMEKELLGKAVNLFRNVLITDLLKYDLFKDFDSETEASIATSPKRYYSTRINKEE